LYFWYSLLKSYHFFSKVGVNFVLFYHKCEIFWHSLYLYCNMARFVYQPNQLITMKKLPIGIQTLSTIIEEGFVYVDKTEIALRLIDQGQYYFLSRPRRFGKSLFIDTLKEIFEGNEALFKGLYIDGKWDFSQANPVLHISFGAGGMNNLKGLHGKMKRTLQRTGKALGLKVNESLLPSDIFEELMTGAYEKTGRKVVILIDEYDKPILDNITDQETARLMRDELRDFYSVIKNNDAHIRLVLITGVSKFSKMSLFSGLNNLNDITLNPDFGNICGYTHEDLGEVFGEHFRGVDMEKVRKWYNGYNYFGDKVYNPFDILLFLSNQKEFRNYWWSTGNPRFLIELLEKREYYFPRLENYFATDEIMDSFDVDNIHFEALLWQTGYLTIKHKDSTPFGAAYTLTIPNNEIQTSLNSLFATYLTTMRGERVQFQRSLVNHILQGDLEGLRSDLFSLFASIPYHNFTNNKIADYEGYYASVIYAYFASLGFEIIAEDASNKSRVDMTLKLEDKIYIFEFKVVEQSKGEALAQIKAKGYHEKYESLGRDIYLVGIEFDKGERNVGWFEWEQV